MPKSNPARSIQSEADLARRIAHERETRGQSYETLARLMKGVGCSVPATAIYKIEKGDPPRRVSVNELVALSILWDLPITDLLQPVELINQRRAQDVIAALDQHGTEILRATRGIYERYVEMLQLGGQDAELREYMENQVFRAQGLSRSALFAQLIEDVPALEEILVTFDEDVRQLAETAVGEV